MPRSRITRTALGCSGLGWLPALAALTAPPDSCSAERLGDLRARAVAGAQEQHPRRRWPRLARGAAARAAPGPGAATRRRSTAARRSAPDRGRSRCRGRRRRCGASRRARRRAAGAGGRRPGSGAGPPARTARRTRRSLRASSLSSRHRSGCPASRRNRGGELSPCPAVAITRRRIHQSSLIRRLDDRLRGRRACNLSGRPARPCSASRSAAPKTTRLRVATYTRSRSTPALRDPARQVREHAGAVLDVDHDDLALARHREVRDRQRVPRGLGVGDEDVQLGPLARPDARGRRDVHARVADRRRDLRQRAGRVLDVDDQVDCHPISPLNPVTQSRRRTSRRAQWG